MIHKIYEYYLKRNSNNRWKGVKKRIHWQLYKYLKRNLTRYYESLELDKLTTDTSGHIIVSLTTIPERIDFIHLAIKSIMYQTTRPYKVVLWLGVENFPDKDANLPHNLLVLRSAGLDIQYVEDLKPHTKYFYAFKTYKNNIIVTIDDDLIYPKRCLEFLWNCHAKYPNAVIANRVRTVRIDNDILLPYRLWYINHNTDKMPSHKLLATGVGGVLYVPNLFRDSLYDVEAIKKLAYKADDIWLKANAFVSEIPVVYTDYFYESFIEIPHTQKVSLNSDNVFESGNDKQIQKVFDYFSISIKDLNDNLND